jgi:succinylarginine dihydrolase
MSPPRDDAGGNYGRLTVRDEDAQERHAINQALIRQEAELARLADLVEQLSHRLMNEEESKELRSMLATRRAYAAATTALKNGALWIVALAAAFTVLQSGFVAAVKAAFGVGK